MPTRRALFQNSPCGVISHWTEKFCEQRLKNFSVQTTPITYTSKTPASCWTLKTQRCTGEIFLQVFSLVQHWLVDGRFDSNCAKPERDAVEQVRTWTGFPWREAPKLSPTPRNSVQPMNKFVCFQVRATPILLKFWQSVLLFPKSGKPLQRVEPCASCRKRSAMSRLSSQ